MIAIVEKKFSECIFAFSFEDILNSVKINVDAPEKIDMFLKLISPDLVLWNLPINVGDTIVDFMDGTIDVQNIQKSSDDLGAYLFNYIIQNY